MHAEQTLPAFAETWARERVMCELDVRFTADGVAVAFHDATLQRVTGTPGHLHEQDLRGFGALRADVLGADRVLARAPEPVPLATLEDVLAFARRNTVNNPAAVLAAADAGVDASITDDPSAARVALDRTAPVRAGYAPASASDWLA